MEKVANGIGCFNDRMWELYRSKCGRYQLRMKDLTTGESYREWICKEDVAEWCRHASWLKSQKLLQEMA